jgi:DNA-binding winged helix-turn-helix (wHTH) protein
VLAFLAANASKVCNHQMILTAVWGTGYSRDAKYLHACIHRLRQKLGDMAGVSIRTSARNRLRALRDQRPALIPARSTDS